MSGDLVTFLAERYAEEWGAARDRELAQGLDESHATRDIDAKRAILEMWQDPAAVRDLSLRPDVGQDHLPQDGRDPGEVEAQVAAAEAIDDVVRILGAVYAARPAYDPAWGPA